jgi:hypothetical protein
VLSCIISGYMHQPYCIGEQKHLCCGCNATNLQLIHFTKKIK